MHYNQFFLLLALIATLIQLGYALPQEVEVDEGDKRGTGGHGAHGYPSGSHGGGEGGCHHFSRSCM